MRKNKQERLFKPARLAFLIAFALGATTEVAHARDYFNPELIELDNPGMKGADLSAFESGSQLPGTYRVDIVLGDQVVDTREIKFDAVKGADVAAAVPECCTAEKLGREDRAVSGAGVRGRVREVKRYPAGFC